PQFDPKYDTHEADLVVEHKVPLDDNLTLDLGPTWNHYALWPERGGVGLTRAGVRKYLANAYAATGNEKYARAWNDLLQQFFVQQKGGGNWDTQMSNALFEFGWQFPECQKSKQWVSRGFTSLVKNALDTVRPDGVLQEPTINYHQLVMGRYAHTIEQARGLGL